MDEAATAAEDEAWDAIIATNTYDLATETGPYATEYRDLLLASWVNACGMPEGLDPSMTSSFQENHPLENENSAVQLMLSIDFLTESMLDL